jgi:uncharacterized membrane protein YhhN
MKKIFIYLFLLVSIGEVSSEVFTLPDLVHLICKPAIMITLGLYYWSTQKSSQQPLNNSLLVAIIFSCAGDMLLMFQESNSNFFMFGLGAFLIAHIFYIFTYKQHCYEETGEELQGLQKIRFALPIVLAGTGLVTILYNRLGDLKIPVLLYAGVLTFMVLNALFRFGKTSTASFAMVFGGAILFMISDSLIAINKFLDPLPMVGFWIMTTYIAAQFLIIKGLIRHQN